jgi:hypothetical protein
LDREQTPRLLQAAEGDRLQALYVVAVTATYGPAKCLRSFGVTWTWKHPKDVSGLVLLDPGPEFLPNTLTPAQWAKSSNGQMAT